MWIKETPVSKEGLEQYDQELSNAAVVLSWIEEGKVPKWHEKAKKVVRMTMPVLARSLDRLTADLYQDTNIAENTDSFIVTTYIKQILFNSVKAVSCSKGIKFSQYLNKAVKSQLTIDGYLEKGYKLQLVRADTVIAFDDAMRESYDY